MYKFCGNGIANKSKGTLDFLLLIRFSFLFSNLSIPWVLFMDCLSVSDYVSELGDLKSRIIFVFQTQYPMSPLIKFIYVYFEVGSDFLKFILP